MDNSVELELWAEDLELEALPESDSPFTTFGCAATAGCGSCPAACLGTAGCFSSNGN
ncbi:MULTISPECIES: thiocillin family RiPP [Streptomyces]|uniref:Thiocillin family RiPP n=3 Tax=Streptomyces TaxID=1883 RepID=A0A367F6N0_9ACTN|nr:MULTISPECIES: thiocillin family RiPP [Streptomyces]RCG14598.1 thiocillin family RiPP [Streptomyces reniochalinae]RCG26018.1 thiocillin family RiPP [Streptomyces diacarni]UNS97087.1 thiocillin family RiPP [Streptomyces tubbatahanensis]